MDWDICRTPHAGWLWIQFRRENPQETIHLPPEKWIKIWDMCIDSPQKEYRSSLETHKSPPCGDVLTFWLFVFQEHPYKMYASKNESSEVPPFTSNTSHQLGLIIWDFKVQTSRSCPRQRRRDTCQSLRDDYTRGKKYRDIEKTKLRDDLWIMGSTKGLL